MCSETHFSLRWNNFGSTMTSALNKLHQLGDFVDVTLAVEGIQLKAHKVVLSACSPYFRNILKNNPCQHPVIILREVAAEDLECVLSFIYEGEVNVSQPRLHTFMRLAEALQVKGLTECHANSSTYSQFNHNSHHNFYQNLVNTDPNVSSLDLSKKVDRNCISRSPKRDSPTLSSHSNHHINHNENYAKGMSERENSTDSQNGQNLFKRRKLSSDLPKTASPLSLHTNDFELQELKINTGNLLEVKVELNDEDEEEKDKDIIPVDNYSLTQKRIDGRDSSESPSMEFGQELGAKSCDVNTSSNSQSQEKRITNVAVKSDKQSNNYQPEFPQDPSCHHTLPYPCPFCEKSYTSWGFRRRHIKGYHAGSPELPCKWCPAVTPSHQEWENHVTRIHNLTVTDARNGILILEEAHMVLQIAQPTRIDSLMELIKNKKIKDKESEEKEGESDKEKKEKKKETESQNERERGKVSRRVNKNVEANQ